MSELPGLLKRRRQALKLSQQQVADLLGVTQALVSKREKGICAPVLADVPALSKVFGIGERRLRSLIIEGIESRQRRAS